MKRPSRENRHRRLVALLLAAAASATQASAQVEVTGYALGVGTRQGATDVATAGTTLFGRTRLMLEGGFGRGSFEAAYEHLATRTPRAGAFSITAPGGTAARNGDWLGADWTIRTTDRTSWRHRLDRLSVSLVGSSWEVTAGRQAISWANTLFLTPADPFSPFDPSDPFREYRGGVDAVRVRAFPGPFTEIEAVVRPAETSLGTTWTALGRVQSSVGGWALGGWAGMLHDEAAAAVFATGSLGATALRAEASLRKDSGGGSAVRGTVGFDRYFTPGDKDLVWIVELQYDGFGVESTSNLLTILGSKPFVRGEMQVLGEWSLATQGAYQVHPLVGIDALLLTNLRDGSALLAAGLSWSATAAASVRLGLFVGAGDDAVGPTSLGSEYGSVPEIGYLSVTWFF